MTISGAIAAARGAVDRARFDDVDSREMVTITRPSGLPKVVDPITFELIDPDPAQVYDGPALISPDTTNRQASDEGGAEQYPARYQCRLPHAVVVNIGDLVAVTASPKAHLVGREFTVDDVPDSGRHVTSICTLFDTNRGPAL